jgi:uncharacterized protein (DUF58 family)
VWRTISYMAPVKVMVGDEEERIDHVISPYWMGGTVLAAAAGLLLHRAPLFFGGAVLLLAFGLSALWGRYCLTRLEFARSCSDTVVPFGGEVRVSLSITNRKLLPLAWVSCTDQVPSVLTLVAGETRRSWKSTRNFLPNLVSLGPYERVIRHYRFTCTARGEQVFGPVELRSGDLFGLATRTKCLERGQSILVLPKVVPIDVLGLPTRFPLGDERSDDRHVADPMRVAGVRQYAAGDSMRQIHWKASARTGSLQTKLLEPSASPRVLLCLNLNTSERQWQGIYPDLLELLISVAASLSTHLAERRLSFGLLANGFTPHSLVRAYVAPSMAPDQALRVLRLLAGLTPFTTRDFLQTLRMERSRLSRGTTIVAITALDDTATRNELLGLQRIGCPVTMLLVGDAHRESVVPGIRTYWIGGEDRWRDLRGLAPGLVPMRPPHV